MKISMLVYPHMTLLDLVGPLQVWSLWPDSETQLVWKDTQPVPTDSAATILPTHSFDDSWADPDILFTGGGTAGTFALLQDEQVLDYLRNRGSEAQWVTSVCTGALILGAAGLLDGYRATTHWMTMDALANFGAEAVQERWVIDRNRATGGGVTAGIDFGLALMAEVAGEEIARTVQLALEYAPQPPFASGHPSEARPETVEQVKTLFSQSI